MRSVVMKQCRNSLPLSKYCRFRAFDPTCRCNKKMSFTKQMGIFRAPNVLTIQLKRFGVAGLASGGVLYHKVLYAYLGIKPLTPSL